MSDASCKKKAASEVLEPCAVKVARTVLRGAGGRKATCLPDVLEALRRCTGNTRLLVTGETARQADHSIMSRKIDTVRVKGRSEPVELFEVLGHAESEDAGLEGLRAAYAEALAWYERREWRRAGEAFESVARTWGGDGPSLVMGERCVGFSQREPGGEWDGVWQLETK